MKFIKLTTNHTAVELSTMLNTLSKYEIDAISDLYRKFDDIEFVDANGFVGMFAAIHSNHITDLLDVYVKLGVNFKYQDITKEALYNTIDTTEFKHIKDELSLCVSTFITDNLDIDTVLEKITDLGKQSLTKTDLLVLASI